MWKLTLHEINTRMRHAGERRQEGLRNLRSLAWMSAYLQRVKRLPEHAKWVDPPKPMTQEEHNEIGERVREIAEKSGLKVVG